MKENIVMDKSKDFAVRIINLYKQILRSGTSIQILLKANVLSVEKILQIKYTLHSKKQLKHFIGLNFLSEQII